MISLTKNGSIDIDIQGVSINVSREQFEELFKDFSLFNSIKTHRLTVRPEVITEIKLVDGTTKIAVPMSNIEFSKGDFILLVSSENRWMFIKSVMIARQINSDEKLAILELADV